VEQERVHKRALWKALPISLMGWLLERRGSVKRAPNFALIEVTNSTSEAFIASVPRLENDFDQVVVLWNCESATPSLAKKFQLVPFSEQFQTRWSLLQHCANGFVFPIQAGASKSPQQQSELKAQLFAHGGNCIVGYSNLKQFLDPGAPLAADFRGPVLVTSLDVNQVAFDQRFLKIRPSELSPATEGQDLSALAKTRQAPVLAIDSADVQSATVERRSFVEHPEVSKLLSRNELIENLIRMPSLSKRMNVRTARLWNAIWIGLGYKTSGKVTADQVKALAIHRASATPSAAEVEKARTTLNILGGVK
jgi:hypothetical protein